MSKQKYRCGGYNDYRGHCGATDCETCYPGGYKEEKKSLVPFYEKEIDKLEIIRKQQLLLMEEAELLMFDILLLEKEVDETDKQIEDLECKMIDELEEEEDEDDFSPEEELDFYERVFPRD